MANAGDEVLVIGLYIGGGSASACFKLAKLGEPDFTAPEYITEFDDSSARTFPCRVAYDRGNAESPVQWGRKVHEIDNHKSLFWMSQIDDCFKEPIREKLQEERGRRYHNFLSDGHHAAHSRVEDPEPDFERFLHSFWRHIVAFIETREGKGFTKSHQPYLRVSVPPQGDLDFVQRVLEDQLGDEVREVEVVPLALSALLHVSPENQLLFGSDEAAVICDIEDDFTSIATVTRQGEMLQINEEPLILQGSHNIGDKFQTILEQHDGVVLAIQNAMIENSFSPETFYRKLVDIKNDRFLSRMYEIGNEESERFTSTISFLGSSFDLTIKVPSAPPIFVSVDQIKLGAIYSILDRILERLKVVVSNLVSTGTINKLHLIICGAASESSLVLEYFEDKSCDLPSETEVLQTCDGAVAAVRGAVATFGVSPHHSRTFERYFAFEDNCGRLPGIHDLLKNLTTMEVKQETIGRLQLLAEECVRRAGAHSDVFADITSSIIGLYEKLSQPANASRTITNFINEYQEGLVNLPDWDHDSTRYFEPMHLTVVNKQPKALSIILRSTSTNVRATVGGGKYEGYTSWGLLAEVYQNGHRNDHDKDMFEILANCTAAEDPYLSIGSNTSGAVNAVRRSTVPFLKMLQEQDPKLFEQNAPQLLWESVSRQRELAGSGLNLEDVDKRNQVQDFLRHHILPHGSYAREHLTQPSALPIFYDLPHSSDKASPSFMEVKRLQLAWAAKLGLESHVRNLLIPGGTPWADVPDVDGRTPLSLAAGEGFPNIVKLLVSEGGSDLESKDLEFQRTPLLWAVANSREEVAELLLQLGSNIDAVDVNGKTCAHLAIENGGKLLSFLLSHAHRKNKMWASTRNAVAAFHLAVQEQQVEAVEKFLKHGSNVRATDGEQKTCFHFAAMQGDEAMIRRLCNRFTQVAQKQAVLEMRDSRGRCAIHYACIGPSIGTLLALLDHGADPNAKTRADDTPLHLAVVAEQRSFVRVLLDWGANVFAINGEGKTPLQLTNCEKMEALLTPHLSQANIMRPLVQQNGTAAGMTNGTNSSRDSRQSNPDIHELDPNPATPPTELEAGDINNDRRQVNTSPDTSSEPVTAELPARSDSVPPAPIQPAGDDPRAITPSPPQEAAVIQRRPSTLLQNPTETERRPPPAVPEVPRLPQPTNELHLAAATEPQRLHEILMKYVDVDTIDQGTTALQHAAWHNQISCARILVLSGANIDFGADNDLSPLRLAIMSPSAGARALQRDGSNSADPYMSVAKYLIEKGAQQPRNLDDDAKRIYQELRMMHTTPNPPPRGSSTHYRSMLSIGDDDSGQRRPGPSQALASSHERAPWGSTYHTHGNSQSGLNGSGYIAYSPSATDQPGISAPEYQGSRHSGSGPSASRQLGPELTPQSHSTQDRYMPRDMGPPQGQIETHLHGAGVNASQEQDSPRIWGRIFQTRRHKNNPSIQARDQTAGRGPETRPDYIYGTLGSTTGATVSAMSLSQTEGGDRQSVTSRRSRSGFRGMFSIRVG